MAIRLSSIVSKLTLDTSEFHTRMQGARKSARSYGKDIVKIGKQLGTMGAAAAAAAGAGLAVLVKQQMASIDESAKFARSIGIATEKLAGLEYTATLNGVSQEQLQTSLLRMTRTIGEAATEGGSYAEVLERLGVNVQELAAKSPDEQLAILADAFAQVENRTVAAATAQEIFGRQGAAMLNVLDLGAQGLAAMQAEAERLGLTFNEIDARQVEAANDAIARVSFVASGAGRALSIELAPYIQAVADYLKDAAIAGEGMGTKVVDAVEWTVKAIASVADYVELVKAGFYGARAVITTSILGWVGAIDQAGGALTQLLNLLPGVEAEWTESFDIMAGELKSAIKEAADEAETSWNRFSSGQASREAQAFFDGIRERAREAAQAAEDAAKSTRDTADAIGEAQDAARQALDAQERGDKITAVIEKLQQEVRLFGLSEDERTMLELEALGASEEQLSQAREAMAQLRRLQEEADAASADAEAAMDELDRPADRDRQAGLVRSGSAQAQLAAYQLSGPRSLAQDEAKRQTSLQSRMASSLATIEQNTRQPAADTWSL